MEKSAAEAILRASVKQIDGDEIHLLLQRKSALEVALATLSSSTEKEVAILPAVEKATLSSTEALELACAILPLGEAVKNKKPPRFSEAHKRTYHAVVNDLIKQSAKSEPGDVHPLMEVI